MKTPKRTTTTCPSSVRVRVDRSPGHVLCLASLATLHFLPSGFYAFYAFYAPRDPARPLHISPCLLGRRCAVGMWAWFTTNAPFRFSGHQTALLQQNQRSAPLDSLFRKPSPFHAASVIRSGCGPDRTEGQAINLEPRATRPSASTSSACPRLACVMSSAGEASSIPNVIIGIQFHPTRGVTVIGQTTSQTSPCRPTLISPGRAAFCWVGSFVR